MTYSFSTDSEFKKVCLRRTKHLNERDKHTVTLLSDESSYTGAT